MNAKSPDRRIVAIHESGHAVMALLWGVSLFTKMSIVKSGNSLGGIDYIQPTASHLNKVSRSRSLGLLDIYDVIVQRIMGGPIAEAMLSGKAPEYQAGTGDSDFDYIVELVNQIHPGSNLNRVLSYVREKEPIVEAALRRMWPAVEALAQGISHKLRKTRACQATISVSAVRLAHDDDTSF